MRPHDVAETSGRDRHDLVTRAKRGHPRPNATDHACTLIAEQALFFGFQRIEVESLQDIAEIETYGAHRNLDLALGKRLRWRFHPVQSVEVARHRTVQVELGARAPLQ